MLRINKIAAVKSRFQNLVNHTSRVETIFEIQRFCFLQIWVQSDNSTKQILTAWTIYTVTLLTKLFYDALRIMIWLLLLWRWLHETPSSLLIQFCSRGYAIHSHEKNFPWFDNSKKDLKNLQTKSHQQYLRWEKTVFNVQVSNTNKKNKVQSFCKPLDFVRRWFFLNSKLDL